jgi:hypothetical protein
MRKLINLLSAVLLVGTGAAAQTPRSGSFVNAGEFTAREDCLYREVGRLMNTRGTTITALEDIATTTAQLCSQTIRTHLLIASPSNGDKLVRYDELQAEMRAMAIGLELKSDQK